MQMSLKNQSMLRVDLNTLSLLSVFHDDGWDIFLGKNGNREAQAFSNER